MLRTWDLASGMPTAVGTEPAAGPVTVVALAADARVLASAAGAAVRVVSAADGATLALRSAEAAVTALAFAPDGAALAIGDAAGTLTIVPLAGTSRAATLKGTAPVTALAFARGGAQLAVGDAAGAVRWVRAADAVAIGTPRVLPQPIRWLDFSTDDATLLLATADWLHALRADAGLGPLASRFAPAPVATMALAAGEGARVRWAEARADARVAVMPFDLAAPPMAAPGGGSRDWPAALGQRLDDAGQPVPFDP
jgi:hypothetical protein